MDDWTKDNLGLGPDERFLNESPFSGCDFNISDNDDIEELELNDSQDKIKDLEKKINDLQQDVENLRDENEKIKDYLDKLINSFPSAMNRNNDKIDIY